jgi:hypothetical protein
VRAIDDLPDHEVYALQGMIAVELHREGRDRALELAREAVALDRGRSAEILAHLEGGSDEEPPPSREQVDAALAAGLAEHRRAHADDRRPTEESLG